MKRSAFLTLLLLLATSLSGAAIVTYKDSGLTQPATEFGDGDKVYFTVTETGITGGTRTVTVTSNGNSLQSVTVSAYDHGLYYDKTANDGIFSGMFVLSTKLTISPSNDPPVGFDMDPVICYKIVPNIHVDEGGTAQIMTGNGQQALVRLLAVFNVEARAIADSTAIIYWDTGDSGYSRVEYGLTSAYGKEIARETPIKDLALSHYITLTGLSPATLYHYRVSSVDTYGNKHVSGDHTFTTITAAQVEAAIRAARSDGGMPNTYYVKTDGNDAEDGLSIATAWQHPSVAVSTADAGDTIYLLDGTWKDEHLVFARSGIDIAPIKLAAYQNSKPVLDGGDNTGVCIETTGPSISISGIRMMNYKRGMLFANAAVNITAHDFVLENMTEYGILFAGDANRVSDNSFYDFEISGGGEAFSYGSGEFFSNMEIHGFTIHDIQGAGIYWRNIDRLHVNDGRVVNVAGSDGVCFSLNTNSSVMENLVVDHTQWHGVAVHDMSVGRNPCYNNTVRNCDISYPAHNHIDLHSGAFDTLVENCVLHEELDFSRGIYFHNRGSGLIARNNDIYNMSVGVTGMGAYDCKVTDGIIENNRVHDCVAKNFCNFYMDLYGTMKITGNTLYNTAASGMYLGREMLLVENNALGEDQPYGYMITYSTNAVIRDPKDTSYYIDVSCDASATLEYTDNRVYDQQRTSSGDTYTLSAPQFTPSKSYSVIGSTLTAKIFVYPLTARPVSSTGTVTVSTFNVTVPVGQYQAVFRASVADNASPMDFTVKSLVPWAWYEVQKDSGTYVAPQQLDASGILSFRNTSWIGSHLFGIRRIPDTVAPVISDVKVADATATSLRIQWTTNEPADSRIEYGKTTEYGSTTAIDATQVLVHSLEIPALLPVRYHFRVISRDPDGNEAVSGDYTVLVNNGGRQVVVPNPYIKGKSRGNKVVFENLPAGAVVRIYAVSGEPVTTLVHDAASGELNEEWDVSDVAGGVYFYTINAGGTTTKGKLGIIK